MMQRSVITEGKSAVILGAARTPIGKYGGSLKDVPPTDLGAIAVREAMTRAGIEAKDVDQVVFGNVIHTEARDMYFARVVGIRAGVKVESPALTVNRLCGSGLQAIASAAQEILLGNADSAVAGGAESMSRGPYWMHGLRWGQRMNNAAAIDVMVGALTDPFDETHMGITAENIARRWNISRQDQDALALESQRRAIDAIQGGRFKDEIVPVGLPGKRPPRTFENDESARADTTLDSLQNLKPAFEPNGTVTAGNASTINDGAAAIVLMEEGVARNRGLKPMARFVDCVVLGVEPKYMGIGPVPAVKKLLQRTGIRLDEIDVFEVNEAFAAQALAVIRDLGLPWDKTNSNGSGISLGHPIGATGAILVVKALYALRRVGGRFALITMCIGGGQGIAAIIESLN
ncbi:MAG: beta-ketothiolase BktB [Candidatus Acidiferrum sp.]